MIPFFRSLVPVAYAGLTMAVLAPGAAWGAPAAPDQTSGGSGPRRSASSEATPPASLAKDLRFLWQEEKLARDVYRLLHHTWALRPFENIAGSEQRHMDRVASLMNARNIPRVGHSDRAGEFADAKLKKLYGQLTGQGRKSATMAMRVGAHIEELDIYDIHQMRSRTTDVEVRRVYDLLECGSRNHLRAFTRQLRGRGERYTPQHLSKTAFDAIILGAHERCGRRTREPRAGRSGRRGDGRGRGPGRRGRRGRNR